MLNLLRLLFAIIVIVLIVPQTPKENIVLSALHSRRMLANYGEEKRFLQWFTWLSIIGFLLVTFFTSVK